MGGRGFPPAPTAIKRAKGETRPSRVNREEPVIPAPDALGPPKGLSGAGQKEWKRVAPLLAESGALKATDLRALEDYCRTLTDLDTFEAAAAGAGPELAIAKGYQGMVIKLRAQANQLRVQLGLTPSSRSAIKAEPKPKQSDDEAFFGGPVGVVGGRGA